MEWKWSKGDPYEKSARIYPSAQNIQEKQTNLSTPQSAISNSLNHDENTWDLMNQVQHFSPKEFTVTNKREELDEKISDRHMIQQCGYNPFMTNDNYVSDIEIRDKFLKPINTKESVSKKEI
jgi:hypothetical protein